MSLNRCNTFVGRKTGDLSIKTHSSFTYMPKFNLDDIVATPKQGKSGLIGSSMQNSLEEDSSSDEFHKRITFDSTSILGRRDTNEDAHV